MTRYVLTIETPPGATGIRAVRAALKSMLRRYGLKCIRIEPAVEPLFDARLPAIPTTTAHDTTANTATRYWPSTDQ